MFTRTERLFLRPGWAEDATELARAIAHEEIAELLDRTPCACGEADARAFLERHDRRFPHLLVTLPGEDGRIVGTCSLAPAPRSPPVGGACVACWITPACRGRGYAREALAGLIDVARMLGHRRLSACPALDNAASTRVLRACGFRQTGQVARLASDGIGYELELTEPDRAQDRCRDWTRAAAYAAAIDAAA